MEPPPDRLQQLLEQEIVTGIDFVYVHPDQTTLDLYFFQHDGTVQAPDILGPLSADRIRIYSPAEGLPDVPVSGPPAWQMVDDRHVLRLTTSTPGDFARYRLRIEHTNLDPYFNDVEFSFKAGCPSGLDCEPAALDCPPEDPIDVAIDYQARDFNSFRQALLAFATQRYPDWQDRLEADMGMMLAEVMSALGDELAYYQDRIAREAYLETATQRRSLRQHARLVDYEMHNGLAASTWLDFTVADGIVYTLPAGTDVWGMTDAGKRISYEAGRGLKDVLEGVTFEVSASRNELLPHIWDEDDLCLPVGATRLYVQGSQEDNLPFDDPYDDLLVEPDGKWVLLQTDPADPADPALRHLVRITDIKDDHDPVYNQDIARLSWSPEQALPFEIKLTELTVHGNLVPVTAGRTVINRFSIGPVDDNQRQALERQGGREDAIVYRFSLTHPELPDEDQGQKEAEEFLAQLDRPAGRHLTWVGDTPREARPDIHLAEVIFDGVHWIELQNGLKWEWRRSLLGVSSSQPANPHYTLEDGTWDRVAGYWRSGQEIVHADYAADAGFTIRFGDGEFGMVPVRGTVFQVTYRLGNGRSGNVPADTITHCNLDPAFIEAVINPLPAAGGLDPETAAEVRQLAPEAFRALTYRAVRPEDYAEAAERLPWVQRAGATLRWTGSWLTLFATPDPLGTVTVSEAQRSELVDQLDRFRQAGREVVVADPRYADLDLEITICIEPFAFTGEVKQAVLAVLLGKAGAPGFFSADNFTFGTPLMRSNLEAVIQTAAGVRAVETIAIRRRGWFDWRVFSELVFEVGLDEVIRLENDPRFPGRGSLRLVLEGGA